MLILSDPFKWVSFVWNKTLEKKRGSVNAGRYVYVDQATTFYLRPKIILKQDDLESRKINHFRCRWQTLASRHGLNVLNGLKGTDLGTTISRKSLEVSKYILLEAKFLIFRLTISFEWSLCKKAWFTIQMRFREHENRLYQLKYRYGISKTGTYSKCYSEAKLDKHLFLIILFVFMIFFVKYPV